MTSAELLKKLFRSFADSDREETYSIAMQIIAAEQRKDHAILARDLMRILEQGTTTQKSDLVRYHELGTLPRDSEQGATLVEVRSPEKYLDEIILAPDLEAQVARILREYRSSAMLRTYGLRPISKILFAGPPGCGKTLCAEVLATELGLPLLYARFDAVISSYLGETASNLRKVFDFAASGKWIVFFDEFDAIGKSRSDKEDHGELKRVVNTYLQLLDGLDADFPVIAATNHQQLLDRALWRRFDEILYFDLPTAEQIAEMIDLKLRFFPHAQIDPSTYVQPMAGWSHSDIERVCIDAIKESILDGQDSLSPAFFERAIAIQERRIGNIDRSRLREGD